MAALDFPNNPTTGDLYGSSGTVWRWDGARWASTAGPSGAKGRVAYAQVTANQSGITGATALTGMTATWAADPTRTYLTTIRGEATPTNAGNVAVVELRDGATPKQRWTSVLATVNAASVHLQLVETGLSGSQTRTGYMNMAVGTGSVLFGASTAFPAYVLVEDITYEAGSSGSATSIDAIPLSTSPTLGQGVYVSTSPINVWYRIFGNVAEYYAFIYPTSNGSGTGVIEFDVPAVMPPMLQPAGAGNAPDAYGTFSHRGYTLGVYGKVGNTRMFQVENGPAVQIGLGNAVGTHIWYKWK